MRVKDYLDMLGLEQTPYPEHVSVSQIGKYQKCPLSWLFSYGTNADGTFPERMLLGSAVHKAMETANYLRMNGTKVDDSQASLLIDAAQKCVDEANPAEYPDLNPSGLMSQATKVIRGCHDVVNQLPPPVLIEHCIDGMELGGMPLRGYIDVVNDQNEILDYKVGVRHKTFDQVNVDVQLGIYAWAMDMRKVGFVSISSATGAYKIIQTEHTKDKVEMFVEYVEWVIKNMQTAKLVDDISGFPPNPNGYWCNEGCSHCIYCPFASLKNG